MLPESGWVQAREGGKRPDLKGKVAFVVFSLPGCFLCNQPMHLARMRYKQLGSKGFVGIVVMSGVTAAERDQKILERKITCPVLLDTDLTIFRRFQCNGAPTTFLTDRNGLVSAVDLDQTNTKAFERRIKDLLAAAHPDS